MLNIETRSWRNAGELRKSRVKFASLFKLLIFLLACWVLAPTRNPAANGGNAPKPVILVKTSSARLNKTGMDLITPC